MGMLNDIAYALGEVIEDMHSEISAEYDEPVRAALQKRQEARRNNEGLPGTMTEEAILALQFLESVLRCTAKQDNFRNNPHASAACNQCVECVATRLEALKTKMQNELNGMMEEFK